MGLRRRTGKRARALVDLRNIAACPIPGCVLVSVGHRVHGDAEGRTIDADKEN